MSASTYQAAELAERLGISVWLLYELTRRGELPDGLEPLKLGRRLVWPKVRVDAVLGAAH